MSRTQDVLTGKRTFTKLPNIPEGIILGEKRKGFFSVVVPTERTTNFVKNPSFIAGDYPQTDIATPTSRTFMYAYTEIDSTMKHDAVPNCFPMYGGWCLVESDSENPYGIYYTALLEPFTYTFSCFVSGKKNSTFTIYITDDSDNIISGKKTIKGTGDWQRIHLTFEVKSSDTYKLVLINDNKENKSGTKFYTSMWVCEDNSFVTLPFTGDYQEKEPTQVNRYSWNGIRGASTSTREHTAINSGKEIFLRDLGFVLRNINGLGISSINHVIERTAGDGGVWNATKVESRDFILAGQIQGETLEERMLNESRLSDALSSTARVSKEQPTTLIMRVYNEDDNSIIEGQTVYIYCRFTGGIATSLPNENGVYGVNLSFTMEDPYIYSSMHKEAYTGITPYDTPKTSEGSTGFLLKQNKSLGKYEEILDPMFIHGHVNGFVRGFDERIYIYGSNFVFPGEHSVNILRYDPRTEDIEPIYGIERVGTSNDNIYCAYPLADGRIVFGGRFDDGDPTNDLNKIAIFDPADDTFSPLGSGSPHDLDHASDTYYNSIVQDKNGNLYCAGWLPDGAMYVPADYPYRDFYVFYKFDFDTEEWSKIGLNPYRANGMGAPITFNAEFNKLLILRSRLFPYTEEERIILCGNFLHAGDISGTKNIASYNLTSEEFHSLGNDGLNGMATDMDTDSKGDLYIVGEFNKTEDGSIASRCLIKYNFSSFVKTSNILGSYTDRIFKIDSITINKRNDAIYINCAWLWYAGSPFDPFPELIMPIIIEITNNKITPIPIFIYLKEPYAFENAVRLAKMFFDKKTEEMWAYINISHHTATLYTKIFTYPEENSLIENKGEIVYPFIELAGKGEIYFISNHTSEKKIFINGYNLTTGEVVTLDLESYSKKPISFKSNKEENITKFLSVSSDLNFDIVNGKNFIDSMFISKSIKSFLKLRIREKYTLLSKAIDIVEIL